MALRLVNNARTKQRSYYAMVKIFLFVFGGNEELSIGSTENTSRKLYTY